MKTLLTALISLYRAVLSPFLPGACRFHPSCSVYAQEAVAQFGAWEGSLLALRRLSRCHPFHEGGYDPVPPALTHQDLNSQISNLESEEAHG